MRCLTDLDHSNSEQRRRDPRARTRERCKNCSVNLRARNRNLRRVAGCHYEVAAVAGFHYEIRDLQLRNLIGQHCLAVV